MSQCIPNLLIQSSDAMLNIAFIHKLKHFKTKRDPVKYKKTLGGAIGCNFLYQEKIITQIYLIKTSICSVPSQAEHLKRSKVAPSFKIKTSNNYN